MEHLFDAWPEVEPKLSAAEHILLLCDFDGTLAPIVPHPSGAELPLDTRAALIDLAGRARYTVGVVSGRALGDLKNRVDIPGIILAGNYGLEIEAPWARTINPEAQQTKDVFDGLYTQLKHDLAAIPGIVLEHKGLSLSVHYRLVSPSDHERVKATVRRAMETTGSFRHAELSEGKLVVEITPALPWDKGKVIDFVLREHPAGIREALVIFLGDDHCDEAGFAAAHKVDGISIHVGDGSRPSHARFKLDSPSEVLQFLRRLP